MSQQKSVKTKNSAPKVSRKIETKNAEISRKPDKKLSRKTAVAIVLGVILFFVLAFFAKDFIADAGLDIAIEHAAKSYDEATRFDGVANFREVILPGKIRENMIFRSSRLSAATPSDVKKLAKLLPDGTVIDLRSSWEVAHAPDAKIPGVRDENFPIRGVGDAAGYVDAFVNDARDRQEFAKALAAIADAKGPVLIHCTFGKDRTGWLVATLMYLAGANDSQVMTEYLRSNHQIPGAHVDAAWLEAAVNAAREKYGSMENYVLNGLKVSPGNVAKIREKLAEN